MIINDLAAQKSTITNITARSITNLLNLYYICQSSAINYYTSDMILRVEFDASYVSFPQNRSCRRGGHYYLRFNTYSLKSTLTTIPLRNGSIYICGQRIHDVIASVTKVKIIGIFINS